MEKVAGVSIPEVNVNSYLARRTIREILAGITQQKHSRLKSAADIGAGYGRLTMVLHEFADEVHAYEREEGLVEVARSLLPELFGTNIHLVSSLADLPAETAKFDFAMTVTVLQHLSDIDAAAALQEIKRVAASGYVLLVEKTDPAASSYNLKKRLADPGTTFSIGRPVVVYQSWMHPFKLLSTSPRVVEPTFGRSANKPPQDWMNAGTYMLFCAPSRDDS
ncbi:MAG: class I SAM-dependent methyltransferase [Anaerolineae bacterium]